MSGVDVHVFRESVARVVRALTDSSIRVRQQGMQAYVEYNKDGTPRCVNLPSIPDNAPADLLNAIQGFLDHEVSHVLHTESKYACDRMTKCKSAGDKMRPALWNIIEDVYVERAMAKRFTGSLINIDNIQRYLTGKLLAEGFAELKKRGATVSEMRSYLLSSAVRAAAGQQPFIDYMADKWSEMGDVADGIRALGSKFKNIKSTRDSWEVVEDLHAVLSPSKGDDGEGDGKSSGTKAPEAKSKKNKPSAKPKPGDEEGEGAPTTDKKKPNDDKNDEGTEGDNPDGEEGEDQPEGDSSDGKDKPDEGDPDSDDDGDGDTDDDSSDDTTSGDGDSSDESGDSALNEMEIPDDRTSGSDDSSPDEGAPTGGSNLDGDDDSKMEDLIDPDLVKPLDQMAAEAIEKSIREHRASDPKDYTPFTRDHDYVGPLPAAQEFQSLSLADSNVAKLASETCHVIQGEVERVFRARSASRWNPGQRRGKLNRSSLHRACIGDDRVFRTKIEAHTRDVAVQLVIDFSGSMGGAKIRYASMAAYMLALVMERINIPFEIIGFTTMSGPVAGQIDAADWRAFRAEASKYRYDQEFSRFAPICTYVYKEFRKRFDDEAKKTLGFLETAYGFMNANADGESLEIAAMRLNQRREPRKVMIVMSDGQPSCDGDYDAGVEKLKQVVQDISRSDIEIYGLGLLDTSVRDYYSKCEVINTVEEIPPKVLALVQQLLIN